MLETKSGELDKLGFKEAVTNSFNFLVREYGFKLLNSENIMVRYETSKVFVTISLGRASMELKVELGLLSNEFDTNQHKFNLLEILELMGDRKDSQYVYFQGSTREQLRKNLPELAGLIKQYAKDILKGDYLTIQSLERLRSDTQTGLAKEIRVRQSLQ